MKAPSSATRSRRFALAALGIGSTVALGAGEFGARVLSPAPTRSTCFDPLAIYAPCPGAKREFRQLPENGGQRIVSTTNAEGFRGPELTGFPADRTLVYGDSCVFAEFAHLEDTFPERLGKEFQRRGLESEVVNAGVIGYGPDQVLARLERDLDRYRPNRVVLVVFADNDYGDTIRNRLYRRDPTGALSSLGVHITASLRRSLERTDRDPALLRLAKKSARRLRAVVRDPPQRLDKTGPEPIRRWLAESVEEFRVPASAPVERINYDHYDADLALTPEAPSSRAKSELLALVLGELARVLAGRQISHTLVVLPSPIDIVDDYDFDVPHGEFPNYDPRRLSGLVVAATTESTWNTVDLWETFRHHDPRTLYFRAGDNHWNAAGQRLAAAVTADAVIGRGVDHGHRAAGHPLPSGYSEPTSWHQTAFGMQAPP